MNGRTTVIDLNNIDIKLISVKEADGWRKENCLTGNIVLWS